MKNYSLILSDGLIRREVKGDLIVIELDSGAYHLFNETGRMIWYGLEKGHRPVDIANRMAKDYGIAMEQAQSDVDGFLMALLGKDLLMETNNCT